MGIALVAWCMALIWVVPYLSVVVLFGLVLPWVGAGMAATWLHRRDYSWAGAGMILGLIPATALLSFVLYFCYVMQRFD
jgi:ABC-type Fe3+ transport system permease subunit